MKIRTTPHAAKLQEQEGNHAKIVGEIEMVWMLNTQRLESGRKLNAKLEVCMSRRASSKVKKVWHVQRLLWTVKIKFVTLYTVII